jgi:hypothetical protein
MYDTVKIEEGGDFLIPFTSYLETDSIVALHVVVYENPEPHIVGNDYHCANSFTYVYLDKLYSHVQWSNGEETNFIVINDTACSVVVTDANGCKGTDIITFEILPLPEIVVPENFFLCYQDTSVLHATGCWAYAWFDKEGVRLSNKDTLLYIASERNGYADTLSVRGYSENGCVVSKTVHVVVFPEYQTVDTVKLCRSELPYERQGNNYTEAGTYPVHYQSQYGCDSLVMMTLIVKENPAVHIIGADSLCEGQFSAVTASGADSYVWSTQSKALSIVVQPGHLYWLEGTATNGCKNRDSIYVRSLPVPVVSIVGPKEACYGDNVVLSATGEYNYQWSDGSKTSSVSIHATENVSYQVTAVNQHDCYASASASLTVYPVYDTSISVSCCSNELPYLYHGYSFTQSGTYHIHLSSIHGCDSLVHLTLTVFDSPYATISGVTDICPGASTLLSANGNGTFKWSTGDVRSPISVNTPGWYVLTVTAQNGCKAYDSVEVAYLPLPELSISGSNSVCRGSELLLEASGAYSYNWNTGVIGPILSVSPSQTTSYVVTGTSDRGCTATAAHTVTVNAVPNVNITGPDAICQGNAAIYTANGGVRYLWSNGDTTAAVRLTNEQLYTVEATNQYGCTATASKYLEVNSLPTVSIHGQDYLCEGGSTILSAIGTGAISYVWNNTTISQSYTSNLPGIYTVVATSSANCTASSSVTVTQYENPVVVVTGNTSFCDGDGTVLTAAGGESYVWRDNYGALIANTSTVALSEGGLYTVVATNEHGCSTNRQVSVVKKNLPYVSIVASGNEVCEGTPVTLSTGASSGYTYKWSTGSTNRQIEVHTSGIYVLQVTSSNGCQAADSLEVNFLPLPEVSIEGLNSICRGSDVMLTASGANSYVWNTGYRNAVLTDVPSQTTTYMVTGTSALGCSSTASHTVVVNALPSVTINGVDAICQGETAVFTAEGGVHYLWSTGDTNSSIQLTNAQLYTVAATNQYGCTATASKYLVVNPVPSVTITGRNYFCEGDNTLLNASGTENVSYIWNNTTVGQSYLVSSPGVYTVKAVSNAGCFSTASVTVSQYSNPLVSVSGDLTFCDGQGTLLTASGGQSYSWRNAYGIVIDTDEEVYLTEGGTYSVVATAANSCTAVQQLVVTKKNLPNASIIASANEVCEGTPVTLNAGWSVGYSYLWSTGAADRQITINTPGVYRLQVTANGCTAVDSTMITMFPLPVITFTGDTMICRGHSTLVYASANNASSFLWTTGETENYISVNPDVTTTYGVTVTDVFGCSNHNTIRVMVEDNPVASISGTDSICVGGSALLQASGGVVYFWEDGSRSPERVIHEAGTYTVMVYTLAGCAATASKTVYYYDVPEITITGNQKVCTGDTTILTAHGGESYLWSNASTDTSIVVSSSGIYVVEGWNTHACSAKDSIEVNILPLPQVQITGDTLACPGSMSILTAEAPTAVDYLWSNGSTDAQITVSESGLYTVNVSDSNGCHAYASHSYELLPVPECEITGPSQICQGETATLTASNGRYFFWSTGATAQSIQVSPNTTTTYTLLVMDANDCSLVIKKQVAVKDYTYITISGESDFCDGDSVLLQAHTDVELIWSNGQQGDSVWVSETGDYTVWSQDPSACLWSSSKHVEKHQHPEVYIEGNDYLCVGDTGTLHAVSNETVDYLWTTGSTDSVITVTSTNVYGVTVTNSFGCGNSASKLLMVYSAPTVGINGPASVCNGAAVTLTATGTATHFLWSTGDTTAAVTLSPKYSSSYQVIGSNDHGCSATASWNLAVLPLPVVSITGDTVLCQGEVSTLTCSNASSFRWSTGANTRSINVSTTGDYSVVVTNTSGCTSSASIYVHVYEQPNLMILGDTMLCRGEQTELLAIGATSYLWSNGATTPSIVVAPESSTSYSVQAFNGVCMAEASRQVVINEKPIASITAPEGICEGSVATLAAQGGMAYLWSTGQTAATIDVHASGTYQLIAFNQYGCTDTTSHILILYPNPQLAISGSVAICQDAQAVLTAIGTGSFLWNTGDTTALLTISNPGLYQVQLTDFNGCTAMESHNVAALPSPVIVIAGPNDMCSGVSVSLTAVCANATSFAWNTGATSNTIEVSPSETTTYSVSAISADGCTAQESHTLAVHQSYFAEYTAEICQGHAYYGQGFSIPVQNEPGVFTFTENLQTVFGCDSIRILHLTVDAIPIINSSIIGNGQVPSLGNFVYMIDPVENANSYEWILSNPNWNISYNQTVAQVTVLTPGTATLSVYALNDCGQSQPVSMQIIYGTGIDGVEMSVVKVYPNPTNGMINVQCTMNNAQLFDGEWQLFDMYGKMLNKWEMSGENMKLDLSSYAAGVYLLKLRDTQTAMESVVKVVKQ